MSGVVGYPRTAPQCPSVAYQLLFLVKIIPQLLECTFCVQGCKYILNNYDTQTWGVVAHPGNACPSNYGTFTWDTQTVSIVELRVSNYIVGQSGIE